ncbi:MAG: hypothetical protein ABII82_13850 [Verrucomicrobiota bacterium]
MNTEVTQARLAEIERLCRRATVAARTLADALDAAVAALQAPPPADNAAAVPSAPPVIARADADTVTIPAPAVAIIPPERSYES